MADQSDDTVVVVDDLQTGDSTNDREEQVSADAGGAPEAAEPDPEFAKKVLEGAAALSHLSEAAAILFDCEVVLAGAEPIGGVLTIIEMIVNVWEALELPERTCTYQGLTYGLMYTVLDKGDPEFNPGWPGSEAAPEGQQRFREGVGEARKRIAEGQEGVKRKNLLLLAIAKDGEKKTINALWQRAVADSDHLLRMFTIEWPNVGPNG